MGFCDKIAVRCFHISQDELSKYTTTDLRGTAYDCQITDEFAAQKVQLHRNNGHFFLRSLQSQRAGANEAQNFTVNILSLLSLKRLTKGEISIRGAVLQNLSELFLV